MRARAAVLAATFLTLARPMATEAAPKPIPAKLTVMPGSVAAGALTTLSFKYQASVALTNVPVTLVVPAGWTLPVTAPASANGYVSITKGTCSIPAPAMSVTGTGPWTVTVNGVSCGANKSFTLAYARTSKSASGPSTFTSTVNAIALTPVVVTVTTGPASKLVFTQQPAGALGGSAFGTQPKVAITDSAGNVVTTNTSSVTLTLAGGTAGATLLCTANPRSAVAGVATFAGCRVNKVGTGYTLHATDGALTATDSAPFAVTAGPAATMAFTQQPGGSITSGTAFATQPKVTLYDLGGNVATDDSSTVALAIAPSTPLTGGPGVLSGCDQSETAGVVTFTGCAVTGAGTGYRLRATDGSLPAVTSAAFDVVGGVATQVVFTQAPGGAITGGVPFPVQPVVQIQSASGDPVVGDVSAVTLSITGGTPASGGPGTLSGCTQSESAGVVTFSGCRIDKVGTGYTLLATDGALTPDDSATFDVATGPAADLSLALVPTTVTAGVSTDAIATVTDAGGNPVDGETVAFDALFGTAGPTAPGATPGTYVASVYFTLAIDHQVNASAGALSDSAMLTVTPAAPYALDLDLSPQTITADEGSTLAVATVTDMFDNRVPGLTVAIGGEADEGDVTDNGDGTYSATVSATTVGDYLVTADAGALHREETLSVTPGAAESVDLVLDPAEVSADVGSTTATVTVTDASGNRVPLATVAITGDATAGTVTDNGDGTYTATVSSTVAGTHVVTAAVGSANDAESLTVTPGAASSIALVLAPDTVADGAESTATATLLDTYDNPITGAAVEIVFASPGDPSSMGTVQDNADGTYSATITASTTGAHDVTAQYGALSDTETLTVTPGAPTALVFSTQPEIVPDYCWLWFLSGGLIGGGGDPELYFGCLGQVFGDVPPPTANLDAFPTQPVISIVDANGNVVDDDTSQVTLSITDGTGTAGAALVGCAENPVTAIDGVATFASCAIDMAGTGYQLHAVSGSLTHADSDALDLVQRAPASITLTLDPTSITADGSAYTTATVTLADSFGNPISNWYPNIFSSGYATVSGVTNNLDGTYTATITGTVAGVETITASSDSGPFFFGGLPVQDTETLTLLPGLPSSISAIDSTSASTAVTTALPTADSYLCVSVQDFYGNYVGSGVTVDLEVTDATNDAGAFFAANPVTTDEFGTACASATASEYAGTYIIRMSLGTPGPYVDFNAGNLAGPVYSLDVIGGDDQNGNAGALFPEPLAVRATDEYGNPVEFAEVTFAAPESGPSASLSATSVATDQWGEASVTATANAVTGGWYDVTATVGSLTTSWSLYNQS